MELEVSHTPENFLYFIFLETILEIIKNVPYLCGYVYCISIVNILMFNVNEENT